MSRKRSSVLEDLMEIASNLPWKVGVGLAVVAYLVLHYFATKTPLTTNPVELKAMGNTVVDGVFSGVGVMLAGVLQYVVPLALLIGAGASAIRSKRNSIPDDGSTPSCPKCGHSMVRRTAKSGANSGNAFWGCSQYPSCRGIRN